MVLGAQAVLFDMDGVLIDTTASVERTWVGWAERQGLEVGAVLAVAHGRPSLDTIRELAPGLDAEAEDERFTAEQGADAEGVVAAPGAATLLAAIPAGRVAVVTSAQRRLAVARFRQAGLEAPAVLVPSDELGAGKPDPEGYLRAAAELGVDVADCVVFEDSPAGVAAGLAAGARVVGLATTHEPGQLVGAECIIADLSRAMLEAGSELRFRLDRP